MKQIIFALVLLTGCTATNKYKGPNFTFDELTHVTNIPPVEYATSILSTNTVDGVIVKSCSEAHSIHSPLIWLPVIGSGLDLLMVHSVSELTGHDAWLWLPLIGPPISYVKGSQYCIYQNLDVGYKTAANQHVHPKLEDRVSSEVIKESITVTYHIGLVGRFFSDKQHEWWSRLGAPLTAAAVAWTLLFGISIFGPAVIEWIENKYIVPALTSGWLAHTAFSVIMAKNSDCKEKINHKYLEYLVKSGPYVFIIGLLFVISHGIQWLAKDDTIITPPLNCFPDSLGKVCFQDLITSELAQMSSFDDKIVDWFLLTLIAASILAWRVNINLFSLHHFYRNRLVRAYLGATNKDRRPNPFTGFDENDDLPIQNLADNNQRPYHIINTALNFTDGENIGYQNRNAASFIFSPKYCGYTYTDDKNIKNDYFQETIKYGTGTHGDHKNGFLLGSAVAISGAAANSMMGYHTSPGLAFLLAIFNVRLGRWCANPKTSDAGKADPAIGYYYLLSELFGYANINKGFVQLSDGGHFENTGLYELVKRGCKHIVVCDAGADPDYAFEDLANAIRKCRTDFGVEIEINVDDLRLHEKKIGKKHYALGVIRYGNYLCQFEDQNKKGSLKEFEGTLIVLKPSLTENEDFPLSTDVQHYAATNKDFPQQTTADQWFDDAQFESYRKLGNHVVEALFKGLSAEEISQYGLPQG